MLTSLLFNSITQYVIVRNVNALAAQPSLF